MEEVKTDKRTKAYKSRKKKKKPDYAKLTKCGDDFSKCMECGKDLPPNEHGSTSFRRVPEACEECIFENY